MKKPPLSGGRLLKIIISWVFKFIHIGNSLAEKLF